MSLLTRMFKQKNGWTCGPAVARLILHWYFSRPQTVQKIVRELKIDRQGTSDAQLFRLLRKNGIRFRAKRNATLTDIKKYLPHYLVVLAYWIPSSKEGHYSIVKHIDRSRVYFHDTWFGSQHSYSLSYFLRRSWHNKKDRWLLLVPK